MTSQRTRTGYAWVAICSAIGASFALIVFIAQNSQPAQVSFLVWQVRMPLAVALLAAAATSGMAAAGVGSARIMQLRRAARRSTSSPPFVQARESREHDTVEFPAIGTQDLDPDQMLPGRVPSI